MSTLLTPIVAQMELDRDRFKDLVNGDELVTVALESRTEKSIAGQVKERIEAMAVSLSDAVAAAETARDAAIAAKDAAVLAEGNSQTSENDAFSAKTAAEGARDQVLSDKADIDLWRADVQNQYDEIVLKSAQVSTDASNVDTWATQTETAKDQAQVAATDAVKAYNDTNTLVSSLDAGIDETMGVSPSMLYPSEIDVVDVTKDITLSASSPRPNSTSTTFIQRQFSVEVEDDTTPGTWNTFQGQSSKQLDYTITANSLDSSRNYRWKVEDVYEANDRFQTKRYTTRMNDWKVIEFTPNTDALAGPITRDYMYIDKPSISGVVFTESLGGDVSCSVFSSPSGLTHSSSVLVIIDEDTSIVHSQTVTSGDLESFSVPSGTFDPNKTYDFVVRYNSPAPESAVSQWSDVLSKTSPSTYYDDTQVQTDITNLQSDKRDVDDIEYPHSATTTAINTNIAKAFTVDRTVNPSLTLSTSATANRFIEVFVYVTGTSGTVTWPGNVSWDTESIPGGAAPTNTELGANWSVVSLQKFDSDWVGRIVAKG